MTILEISCERKLKSRLLLALCQAVVFLWPRLLIEEPPGQER